jgi:hypothetical protein
LRDQAGLSDEASRLSLVPRPTSGSLRVARDDEIVI